MDLRYLRLTVTLLFLERIWSLPVGCQYNGTAHGEGETVRMEEPCLSCVCQGGALECSLRVCADQPNALPPGCFFLHKPNECCPQLFCDESFSPTGVELRTGMKLENKLNGNDCWINGSRYAEGSAVASPRVCEYCYCVEGETRCLKPRCLQAFQGCRAVHEKSSCCPTHYDCRDADVDLLTAQIESFALANVDTKNDSSTTLPNLNVENEGTHLNDSKSDENVSEEEEKAREEVGTTTTEAATTEETTVPPDEEATPAADDAGLQTMKTEYSTKEATPAGTTEGTTQVPEATTDAPPSVEGESATASDAQNGVDFPEATETPGAAPNGSLGGLSPEADDYEAYDYGEPRLPPSLPNLVIFPFVAADAVVKDDTSGFDSRDRMEIKRIDAHPVFYKDYFSPPAKTEGGFVPKEPFYDQAYFREDQVEPPGADPKAVPPCQDVACPLPQFDERWTKVTSSATSGIVGDLENGEPPFVQELRPGIEETPTDYIFRDESPPFQKSQQTKKPVTVTYKNVVVDFYPNYLVTTTRARPGVGSPAETRPLADEVQVDSPETPAETKFAFPQNFALATSPKTTRETPAASTPEPSLFDEFFKSFLSDDIITTTPSAKHKYSSKIKGNANAVQDVAGQKAKPEIAEATTWTDSPSNSLFGTEDSTVPFSTTKSEVGKQVKKDGTKSLTKSTTPATWTQEGAGRGPAEADAGALLKLAGCNIYGMMYRVGKLITELSGPCLECLCTDLGVQCRPLAC